MLIEQTGVCVEYAHDVIVRAGVAFTVGPFGAGEPVIVFRVPVFVVDAVQRDLEMLAVAAKHVGGLLHRFDRPGVVPILAHPLRGRQAFERMRRIPFAEDHRGLRLHVQLAAKRSDRFVILDDVIAIDAGAVGLVVLTAVAAGPPADVVDDHLDGDRDHGVHRTDSHTWSPLPGPVSETPSPSR